MAAAYRCCIINSMDNSTLDAAVAAVRNGRVIAYPTESVYGLGCDPSNAAALQRLIDIKGRAAHKGFIVVASQQQQLSEFLADIGLDWQKQFNAHWPGPVTFVVPAAQDINALLSGGRKTLAVRVSAHPVVQSLCTALGGPLVSTSANISGQAPLCSRNAVQQHFGSIVDTIVDGLVGELTTPTPIIDVRSGLQLRD